VAFEETSSLPFRDIMPSRQAFGKRNLSLRRPAARRCSPSKGAGLDGNSNNLHADNAQ
jgi:hypothetical protein